MRYSDDNIFQGLIDMFYASNTARTLFNSAADRKGLGK